ncbi:hypothetical protein SMD22_01685 (plasmid) [Brevibacillus halotolerans]|nr:hypothetical protein SMD22_01685 [Brevibacillus halotolerans]
MGDKEYIVKAYYNNKHIKARELDKLLGISQRAMLSVFKEFGINSKRKNRYTLNESFFETIDCETKAYILGFLYADGFVGDEKANNIVFSSKDLEIIEKIARELEYTGDIRKTRKGGFEQSKKGHSLNFSSSKMANDLRNLGLYPNKSLTLSELPKIPDKLMRHFLRGYYDGDGSVGIYTNSFLKKGNRYTYERFYWNLLATEGMIENFVQFFGFEKYSMSESKTKELKYLVISAKEEVQRIYPLLYEGATIYLERKFLIWVDYWGPLRSNV